jgi:hypothetical protein
VGSDQLDEAVLDRALGVALAVSLDVAEVADVALLILGRAVGLAVWVEVRSGRRAPVGVIAESVDVHATLRVGIVACDIPGDLGGCRLGLLLEHDGARDLGVTADDADCATAS